MNAYATALVGSGAVLALAHIIFLAHWTTRRIANKAKWLDSGWWLIISTWGQSAAWIITGLRLIAVFYGRKDAGATLSTFDWHVSLWASIFAATMATLFTVGYLVVSRQNQSKTQVEL